jgi:hypothetical protein
VTFRSPVQVKENKERKESRMFSLCQVRDREAMKDSVGGYN